MEELKKEFKKLYNRPPHYRWSEEKIREEINKKKNEVIKEIVPPPIQPVQPQPWSTLDPMIIQILKWQQDILSKLTESIDEIKEWINKSKPITPEEAKDIFNEELKNSHFESKYTYEIYALKRTAADWSEERDLTWHQFGTEEEAEEYWNTNFAPAKWWRVRYKIMKIRKPYLVKHNK